MNIKEVLESSYMITRKSIKIIGFNKIFIPEMLKILESLDLSNIETIELVKLSHPRNMHSTFAWEIYINNDLSLCLFLSSAKSCCGLGIINNVLLYNHSYLIGQIFTFIIQQALEKDPSDINYFSACYIPKELLQMFNVNVSDSLFLEEVYPKKVKTKDV